ncbi:MAG: UDP-N-acetylmuramate--L-alanine ligase [Clostridium sp.]|jgi:UDP-N-acetylmuramate--alanine ligase|nr:UDP-N-acetylmuramate--L-alanine ligase [Clostridium sp.]
MYQIDFHHPSDVYFVGIGGISMSGLAEILARAGFRVSGSDSKASAVTAALEQKGIRVFIGQREENIGSQIDCAIFTSAIRQDNPEYAAVRKRGIPSLTRAELLGQIMKNYATSIAVSGTHGKTTTTSMIGEILLHADADPTLTVGGMLRSIGGNLRIGKSDFFVTEACEYTNSFLHFFPKIGLILNIEEDHLDFFQDLAQIRRSFREFARLIPEDGCLIINGDIPAFAEITDGLPCRVVTYGSREGLDYHAENLRYVEHAQPVFALHGPGGSVRELTLRVPGEHNVSNAMAAAAAADFLAIPDEITARALQGFTGTDRRFEYKGSIGGLTVIDDYAHHPTEITATLKAAGYYPHNTLWCVFQPHTYSRTHAFLKDFAQALALADKVVLADIYAARETNTFAIHSQDLREAVETAGGECYYFPTFDEIENFLLGHCADGDLLITMGAGDVHIIGENLLGL